MAGEHENFTTYGSQFSELLKARLVQKQWLSKGTDGAKRAARKKSKVSSVINAAR